MKLWLVTRSDVDYDEYRSFVCAAPDAETALTLRPDADKEDELFNPDADLLEKSKTKWAYCEKVLRDGHDYDKWVQLMWAMDKNELTVREVGTSISDKIEIVHTSFLHG